MTDPAPVVEGSCYAVIFTTRSRSTDSDLYLETARKMEELAVVQPGYLGIDSARTPGELGITVSYWRDLGAIKAWRDHAEHTVAQRLGRERFYEMFTLRIAKVEHARAWRRER